jgi:hypothetical protein
VLREVLGWWLGLTGQWLLTLSTVSAAELVAAGVVAGPCAFAARSARRAIGAAWRPRIGWVKWLGPIPWTAVRESLRVLFRRVPDGTFEDVGLPAEAQPVHDARLASSGPAGLRR